MKIFQYSLLVNRNGVFVLTAKGILKFFMKNFTTAFVREVYVKCTSKHPKDSNNSIICLQYCICYLFPSAKSLSLFYIRGV